LVFPQKVIPESWEKVKAEIEKCALLCANCHREFHAGKLQLSQATVIEKSDEFREALTKKI
jgi:predicted HNH restriction endonuclease